MEVTYFAKYQKIEKNFLSFAEQNPLSKSNIFDQRFTKSKPEESIEKAYGQISLAGFMEVKKRGSNKTSFDSLETQQ